MSALRSSQIVLNGLFGTSIVLLAIGLVSRVTARGAAAEKQQPAARNVTPEEANDTAYAKNLGITLDEFRSLNLLDHQIYMECVLVDRDMPSSNLDLPILGDQTKLNDSHIERVPGLPRIKGVHLSDFNRLTNLRTFHACPIPFSS